MDRWEKFVGKRFVRFGLWKRRRKPRGEGRGGEPVVPPPDPLPGLSGGAAVAIDDDQPSR